MCGASYWQAARSNSKSQYTTLDETGLVVAGCRHVLALKAVNMFAGEQYGYSLFLHQQLADAFKLDFVWQDIMCKYWPWLERVARQLPAFAPLLNSSKALSVMHAKAHSIDCQVPFLLYLLTLFVYSDDGEYPLFTKCFVFLPTSTMCFV